MIEKMKKYMIPTVETVFCQFQYLMKVASEEPIDPGNNSMPAPRRRTEVF